MSWNYRVVKTEKGYSVFEVYYDEIGIPNGITEKPTLDFYCDSPEGILEELESIKKAIEEPTLTIDEIKDQSKNT